MYYECSNASAQLFPLFVIVMLTFPACMQVRAAKGLESVDFFMQGYWVWNKIVEALAEVGGKR